MSTLTQLLRTLTQRSGGTSSRLETSGERAQFQSAVKTDVASIMQQLNSVYKPLVGNLLASNDNELTLGLSGNVLFSDAAATAASASAYWNAALSRKRSIKETFDVFLSEVARLENSINDIASPIGYDDTALTAIATRNQLNLKQLRLDSMGSNYSFDNDGLADLAYPLSQAIDAMGAFFAGFPGTGNTYPGVYPAITLAVNLSDVVLDTTVPQSTTTDLVDHLGFIRTFIGKDVPGAETPTYSDHGAISYVADGDSLEVAIQKLDAATGVVSVNSEQDFYFIPGGVAAGNRYTDWDLLYADALTAAGNGHVRIYFDGSMSNPIVMPDTGVYDMTNMSWHGLRHIGTGVLPELIVGTAPFVGTTAQYFNLGFAQNILFHTPVASMDCALVYDGLTNDYFVMFQDCTFWSEQARIILATGATSDFFLLLDGCGFSQDPFLEVDTNSNLRLRLRHTSIEDDKVSSIDGTGTINYLVFQDAGSKFSTTQTAFTGVIADPDRATWASSVGFDDATFLFTADDVQTAMVNLESQLTDEYTDGMLALPFLQGIPNGAVWTATCSAGLESNIRTATNATDDLWIDVPLPNRSNTTTGIAIKSIEANYTVDIAALDDVRFELWLVTLAAQGAQRTAAVYIGNLDAHYDVAHDTAAERGAYIAAAPTYHRVSMTNPDYPGIQYADFADDQYLKLRVYVDGTATGVLELTSVMLKFNQKDHL